MYLFLSTSSATTLAQVTSCPTWPSKVIPKLVLSLEFILQPSATVRFPESCPHLLTPLTQCMLFLQTSYRPYEHLSSHRCHLKMTRPKDTLRVWSVTSCYNSRTISQFLNYCLHYFSLLKQSSPFDHHRNAGNALGSSYSVHFQVDSHFYFHHLQCHREAGLPHSSTDLGLAPDPRQPHGRSSTRSSARPPKPICPLVFLFNRLLSQIASVISECFMVGYALSTSPVCGTTLPAYCHLLSSLDQCASI